MTIDAAEGINSSDVMDQDAVQRAQSRAVVAATPAIDCEMAAEEIPEGLEDSRNNRKRTAHGNLGGDVAENERTPRKKSDVARGDPTPLGADNGAGRVPETPPSDAQMDEEDVQMGSAGASGSGAAAAIIQMDALQLLAPEVPGINILETLFVPGVIHPGVKISNGAQAEAGYEVVDVTIDGTSKLLLRSLQDPTQHFTRLATLVEANASYTLDNIHVCHGTDDHRSHLFPLLQALQGPLPTSCVKFTQEMKVIWIDAQHNWQTFNAYVKIQGTSELKIWRNNPDRLPYEHEDECFGYVLNDFTEEKFFKVPIMIFSQEEVDDKFLRALRWVRIRFVVHAPNSETGKPKYQYGNINKDFGFIRDISPDKANVTENNIIPDGQKRKRNPPKL